MKFMKLGCRPDTFYSSKGVRSVSSDVRSDIVIQVNETRYLLHKFPLLSKCLKLQRECSEIAEPSHLQTIDLPDFPGGCEAFELCAKFCYGMTVIFGAYNIVSALCAATFLQMTEVVEKGNLVDKLELFFNSCILNGWKDCILVLQATKSFQLWSEELRITNRCIESLVSKVLSNPSKVCLSRTHLSKNEDNCEYKGWWGEDLSKLQIDVYWRTMAALKSGGKVPANLIGDALSIYTSKWLPKISSNIETETDSSNSNSRLLLESIITLLPAERNAVSCSFLLRLLKAANILRASVSSRLELARRVALQLDEANVCDLMIPCIPNDKNTIYDIDIVLNILEQFMLPRLGLQKIPAENGNSEFQESSALKGSMIKVAKLVDGYLKEIGRDVNVPLSKFIALIEAIPQVARPQHDDLYRAIDVYLKSHPDLNKNDRKKICGMLDCKKLSLEVCMHAAQNEMLPLRVVVQILFIEQVRMTALPSNIKKALLAAAPSELGSLSTDTSPHMDEST